MTLVQKHSSVTMDRESVKNPQRRRSRRAPVKYFTARHCSIFLHIVEAEDPYRMRPDVRYPQIFSFHRWPNHPPRIRRPAGSSGSPSVFTKSVPSFRNMSPTCPICPPRMLPRLQNFFPPRKGALTQSYPGKLRRLSMPRCRFFRKFPEYCANTGKVSRQIMKMR